MRLRLMSVVLGFLLMSSAVQAQNAMNFFSRNGFEKEKIDYSAYEEFLGKYIKSAKGGMSRFDYKNIPSTGHDLIKKQMSVMENVRVTNYDRDTQLGYWLNLYNIIVLDAVLENYPISSIRDVSDIWKAKRVKIQSQELSLDDIEHNIIRPLYKDWRIHAALNVATVSSGRIPAKAYGYNIEKELDDIAKEWLQRPDVFRISDNTVSLSTVFKWYKEDFGNSTEELFMKISGHLNESASTKLLQLKKPKIRYNYVWDLNDMGQ